MIYVDLATGSVELIPLIRKAGVPAERTSLPFGDFCFDGKGPEGDIVIGVERKTLHDMMACIQDARFAGHQLPGMKALYTIRILMVEGHWRPHDENGMLMEGFNGGTSWGVFRGRQGRQMYSSLYRYLISVSLSGCLVMHSRDMHHTARNLCELYAYFQKPWNQHTSLKAIHTVAVPSMMGRPSLTRLWARDLPGIGEKLSDMAARVFGTPFKLANAEETDWLKVPGVGVKTAQDIYRKIRGIK